MTRAGSPLIVALDTGDPSRLADLAAAVAPYVAWVKVGLQAYVALGPAAVAAAAEHAPVFCDLKLHDIPNTVAGAAAAAAAAGADLLTVHAAGGARMMAAATESAGETTVLAVTVLTSLRADELAAVGQPPAAEQVPRLARLAMAAGVGGVVCSPAEVTAVRTVIGDAPLVVVPGIRPAGGDVDDQALVATPAAALAAGASHIVVGRPVTRAADPAAACRDLLATVA